ncbi:NAD(P)H-dependent oxidoreductase [bacterium]|nr:NAD(P)H-dependent oxidoreductase [bacterium]
MDKTEGLEIAIISGSARINNNTIRVAKAISNELGGAHIVDYQNYSLPNANDGFLGNEDLDEFQEELISSISKSHLLFVLTPEYNWFPSAEIINTIHHLATKTHYKIMDEMVVAFVGVSTGRGGRLPSIQLSYVFDKVFNVFNLNSITSPKKFESQFTIQCIDPEGNLLDNEAYNKGLKDFVQYSVNVAKRWHYTR